MKWPRITIVTPNFNMERFLEQTITSVVAQNYANLEYIVIDGGSTDDSARIIKKYDKEISYWVSEPDSGLYAALNKGFQRSTGEIMGWLNSDDILHEGSLTTVAKLFTSNVSMNWLQGYPNTIDMNNQIIHKREHVSSKYNFYLRDFTWDMNAYVQQESTFWRRSLWKKAGEHIDERYKLAGDFELWMRFFRHEKLCCSRQLLGAYRKRPGQKSSDIDAYNFEANQIVDRELRLMTSSPRFFLQLLSAFRKRKHLFSPLYNKFASRYFENRFVD